MVGRWLSIIGIGDDGRAGLSASALSLIDGADLVVGGRRHLELIGPTRGDQRPWSTPLDATIPLLQAYRGRPVCVLASGDPFWFGAGVTLARDIPIAEILAVPSPSSFSIAASRLGWALQDTVTLGLNMSGLTPLIRRHLHHGRRILALSLNGETPRQVAELLTGYGFGCSKLTILQALGGPRERICDAVAKDFNVTSIDPLNIVAIDVVAQSGAQPIAVASGLADDLFEHDGQITKREIRAVTLSSLAPCPGQLLWDVGLGSGSVAIEWLLSHASMRSIGFERQPERAARAARNAIALGVPHLVVHTGVAPQSFANAAVPDAIFIGGGATTPGVFDACWQALRPGGRMVVNAVTVETEAFLISTYAQLGGSLTRIAIDRAEAVGSKHGWRSAMPVVQWVGAKPWL